MNELELLRQFRADVPAPRPEIVAAARQRWRRPLSDRRHARRRLLVIPAVAVLAAGAGLAVAGTGLLNGPAAPPVQNAALQGLLPSLGIGHARTLTQWDGRALYGAATRSGGYCFSATSPTDPEAAGGYCVSPESVRRLDHGRPVAFGLSGGSIAGYAPGAVRVQVTGLGIDASFPVTPSGWWLGAIQLPEPPLAPGQDDAVVTAVAVTADGRELEARPVLRIHRVSSFGIVIAPGDSTAHFSTSAG